MYVSCISGGLVLCFNDQFGIGKSQKDDNKNDDCVLVVVVDDKDIVVMMCIAASSEALQLSWQSLVPSIVEHHITEVMGSNPVGASDFFSGLYL